MPLEGGSNSSCAKSKTGKIGPHQMLPRKSNRDSKLTASEASSAGSIQAVP